MDPNPVQPPNHAQNNDSTKQILKMLKSSSDKLRDRLDKRLDATEKRFSTATQRQEDNNSGFRRRMDKQQRNLSSRIHQLAKPPRRDRDARRPYNNNNNGYYTRGYNNPNKRYRRGH